MYWDKYFKYSLLLSKKLDKTQV